MHMHVRHVFGMRTTVELSDRVRAKLLELAARRGDRGFSALVEEAVERYVANADSPRSPRRAANSRSFARTHPEKPASGGHM